MVASSAGPPCPAAASRTPEPEVDCMIQNMDNPLLSQFVNGITSATPTSQSKLYSSWSMCENKAVPSSILECREKSAPLHVSEAENCPDVFGLISSIPEEPNKLEPVTDWITRRCEGHSPRRGPTSGIQPGLHEWHQFLQRLLHWAGTDSKDAPHRRDPQAPVTRAPFISLTGRSRGSRDLHAVREVRRQIQGGRGGLWSSIAQTGSHQRTTSHQNTRRGIYQCESLGARMVAKTQ